MTNRMYSPDRKDHTVVSRLFTGRLFTAATLLLAATVSLCSQPLSSAREVLMRFCDRDAQGDQLSPDGWKKLAALFVSPRSPRRDQLTVVKDFVVSEPAPDKDTARFYVEYIELGRIDLLNKRFYAAPGMKVRRNFDVVRTSGDRDPRGWRIAGQIPQPHLTVDASIRYATELRAKASGVDNERSLDKLLADLKRLR